MPADQRAILDSTDHGIISHLQSDGRASTAEIARAVSLSPSATAERIRRLTETGVITGYPIPVHPAAPPDTLMAFVRLAYSVGNYKPFDDLVATTPEILEAHHVTGEDCFMIKVLARSMRDLERITGRMAGLGRITTSVLYSSPLPTRHISPAT